MKKHRFYFGLLATFLLEIAALFWFSATAPTAALDTLEVNAALQSVQEGWDHLKSHENDTALNYTVLDLEGKVLFCTADGLSESLNTAIAHRDTILDVSAHGQTVGKLIIYNDSASELLSRRRAVSLLLSLGVVLQCVLCIGYAVFLNHTILRPFEKKSAALPGAWQTVIWTSRWRWTGVTSSAPLPKALI